MTPVLSVAVARALRTAGVKAGLRWPNDVVVGEAKIAGIIAEARIEDGKLVFVAVGAGVNVNQDAGFLSGIDRPATSVFAETGRRGDPYALLKPILGHFDCLLSAFLESGFSGVFEHWSGLMDHGDEMIALDFGDRIVKGRIRGFGEDGSIEIEGPSGLISRHLSGEVVRVTTAG